jgi:hypothetical protein
MQTVNKLIEQLLELQKQGYGELPLIYATDAEGNAYHKVYSKAGLLEVKNIDEHYLELLYDEDIDDYGTNYNCVIIN